MVDTCSRPAWRKPARTRTFQKAEARQAIEVSRSFPPLLPHRTHAAGHPSQNKNLARRASGPSLPTPDAHPTAGCGRSGEDIHASRVHPAAAFSVQVVCVVSQSEKIIFIKVRFLLCLAFLYFFISLIIIVVLLLPLGINLVIPRAKLPEGFFRTFTFFGEVALDRIWKLLRGSPGQIRPGGAEEAPA